MGGSLYDLEFVGGGDFWTMERAGILFSANVRAFRGLVRDVRRTGRSSLGIKSGADAVAEEPGRFEGVWKGLLGD